MSDDSHEDLRDRLPLSELSFHILLSLGDGPAHGYAVGKEIEARSGGTLKLTTGALYQALKRLRDDGLLEPAPAATERADDSRRRYFRLTERGREAVALEAERLERLLATARAKQLYPASG